MDQGLELGVIGYRKVRWLRVHFVSAPFFGM